MTNQELVKQLAERGMGLHWEPVKDEYGFEMGGWYTEDGQFFRPTKKVYLDVDQKEIFPWNPLTDWNDCMMLVEQMIDLGAEVDIMLDKNGTMAIIAMSDNLGQEENEDDKKAICMAAAKALGIEIPG